MEQWADWTGEIGEVIVKHPVSEIPEEYLIKITQKLITIGFYRNKLKRLVYWLKAKEFKYILKSVKRLVLWRGTLILPLLGMKTKKR